MDKDKRDMVTLAELAELVRIEKGRRELLSETDLNELPAEALILQYLKEVKQAVRTGVISSLLASNLHRNRISSSSSAMRFGADMALRGLRARGEICEVGGLGGVRYWVHRDYMDELIELGVEVRLGSGEKDV